MDITIFPQKLSGSAAAIPSKSAAHRLLICAAFSENETKLICPETNADIEATMGCLTALGAKIEKVQDCILIAPCKKLPARATLNCCESGSTLRFLLPIVGALGVDATFLMSGRLPQRPLSPLWEEMERMGCKLCRPAENTIRCQGKLRPGNYTIDGGVSSQFITGLLLALSLMEKPSHLDITGKVESRPYIAMTKQAMALFDAPHYRSPGTVAVEGDWSNAAFFLAAAALGSNVAVTGLSSDSEQGDRAVVALLSRLNSHAVIDASDIPDLVPILAVAAGARQGAVFTNVQRLRLKESDRVDAVVAMLTALGGKAEATQNSLTVFPTGYRGGTVDAFGDHRIAMAAAIAATVCSTPVTVLGAEAVSKSYPRFWEEYQHLGGHYELILR